MLFTVTLIVALCSFVVLFINLNVFNDLIFLQYFTISFYSTWHIETMEPEETLALPGLFSSVSVRALACSVSPPCVCLLHCRVSGRPR